MLSILSSNIRSRALFLGLIGWVLGAGWVYGQYWNGRAVVELRVSGARSGGVANASVDLTFLDGGELGPQGLTTNSNGEVTISGLAEGLWRVRISHPDFFSYVTVVTVELDKKVEVIEAAHEASPTGSGLLRAKFGRVKAGKTSSGSGTRRTRREKRAVVQPVPAPVVRSKPSVVPTEAVSEHPKETPVREPVATEESEVREKAPQAERQEPSLAAPKRVQIPLPPSPEGHDAAKRNVGRESTALVAPSIAEPGSRNPAEPEPSAAPPVAEPSLSTPAAREEPVEQMVLEAVPMPEPAPVPVSEPAGSEPSAPVVSPRVLESPAPSESVPVEKLSAAVRSWDLGTCHDCRPGESALSVDVTIPAGSGGCAPEAEAKLRMAVAEIGSDGVQALRGFFGPLVDQRVQSVTDRLGSVPSQEIETLVAPLQAGSCQVLVAILPASAKFTGYRYEARDFAAGGDCLPDLDCPIGDAVWIGNPGIIRGQGFTAIWASFSNRSQDRVRYPRLSVYFSGN